MSESNSKHSHFTLRWWQFCQERFPLFSHGPMLFLLVYSFALYSETLAQITVSPLRLLLVFFFTVLFFFQLRLFDEIKDYEHDLVHNPTRPLPRGLVSIKEVGTILAVLIVLQFLFAFSHLDGHLVFWWPLTISYSLLMYKEFFIGKYLRPHLTTYAMTHTWVTVLLGFGLLGQFSTLITTNLELFKLVLGPWFIFNLFEFARKTFAPTEEKENVPSYSNVFGLWGAVFLSFSQTLAAAFLLWQTLPQGPNLAPNLLFFLAGGLLSGLLLGVFKNIYYAKLFRLVSSLQIVIYFLLVIFHLKGLL